MKEFGILYVLFNLKTNNCSLLKELIRSIDSIKRFHPDINIIIFIEKHHDYDKYYKIPSKIKKYAKFINFSKEYNYNYDRDKDWMGYPAGSGPIGINRILCLINTPFKYTLHLDCDTIINNSLNDLIYNCKNDIYLTLDNWWVYKNNELINELESNKSSINSGVILYKNTDTNIELFKKVINLIYTRNLAEQNAISYIFKKNISYLNNRYYNFRSIKLLNIDDCIIFHTHNIN